MDDKKRIVEPSLFGSRICEDCGNRFEYNDMHEIHIKMCKTCGDFKEGKK